jgi:hypothetical protein
LGRWQQGCFKSTKGSAPNLATSVQDQRQAENHDYRYRPIAKKQNSYDKHGSKVEKIDLMGKKRIIRDPVHGFISLKEWEWDIINHPCFQRLKRIQQLALTSQVYPGACHTRFEHSLGVLHTATTMFDHIVEKDRDFLTHELKFNDSDLEKDRQVLRISALLHDIGHPPFSHATEKDLFGLSSDGKRYKHEHYSSKIIVELMKDVIESHPENRELEIEALDIANFIDGDTSLGRRYLWKSILSSHLDADRADYLLRDSLHTGVSYGFFDLQRLINTISVAWENDSPVIAVEEGGRFVAESLIIARYMMFNQVYFHPVRVAYDHHLTCAVKHILKNNNETYPSPSSINTLEEYVKYDDWSIYSDIKNELAGEHGRIIMDRNHYRVVYETKDIPDLDEIAKKDRIIQELGNIFGFEAAAEKSWYSNEGEITILRDDLSKDNICSLSELSHVVKNLKKSYLCRIYVPMDKKVEARNIINRII